MEAALDKYPQLSNVVYQRVLNLLRAKVKDYSVTVTKEHLESFEKLLKTKAP